MFVVKKCLCSSQDAKKDETNKKIYKLFININTTYEELLKTLDHSSQVDREVIDLEDQVGLVIYSGYIGYSIEAYSRNCIQFCFLIRVF